MKKRCWPEARLMSIRKQYWSLYFFCSTNFLARAPFCCSFSILLFAVGGADFFSVEKAEASDPGLPLPDKRKKVRIVTMESRKKRGNVMVSRPVCFQIQQRPISINGICIKNVKANDTLESPARIQLDHIILQDIFWDIGRTAATANDKLFI